MIQTLTSSIDENTTLRWNAGLVLLVAPSGTISVLLEHRQFHVSDPLLVLLIRLLQQPQSLQTLFGRCKPAHDSASVQDAVEELCLERIIVVADPHLTSRSSAAFWDMLPRKGRFRPVGVHSLIPNFGISLEALLQANEVPVAPDCDRFVVVTDDYVHPEMAHLAATSNALLPAKPVGNEVWIGPCLSAETSLCWECVAYWLRLRRWPELAATGLAEGHAAPSASIAWLPSTMNVALGLIATATTLWSSRQSSEAFTRRMWTLDLHTFEARSHPIVARRNCAKCRHGDVPDQRLLFDSLQSPKFGIVDKLRMCDRRVGFVQLAHCAVLLPLPRSGVRDVAPPPSADGKGPTMEEALRRCTMEAIERYSSVFTGHEQMVRARASEIDCLSIENLLLFSGAQREAREEWNQRPGDLHGVPERFDPHTPTAWVNAQSLRDGRDWFVQAGYSHLWYPFRDEPFYNYADTNGCAAGETREDATLRGLLELIERDALAIWWYNRIRRPGIDLSVWHDEDIQATITVFAQCGRSVALLDLTHDLKIPVFAAVSADGNGRDIYFGCAADVCPASAAKRALAELIQFWYWSTRSGASVDRRLWLEAGSLDRHSYLTPRGLTAEPEARQYGTKEALTLCTDALMRSGVEAFAIDLTKPELGIPVMRVVAPGLRHYGPRFAPGRLYDVPVRLGWLPAPLSEEEMNPDPCVL